MGKLFPPFKVDIAGALCVPSALRDARSRYQGGQISQQTLRAVENAEIRSLIERLRSEGVRIVTDFGVMISWKPGKASAGRAMRGLRPARSWK